MIIPKAWALMIVMLTLSPFASASTRVVIPLHFRRMLSQSTYWISIPYVENEDSHPLQSIDMGIPKKWLVIQRAGSAIALKEVTQLSILSSDGGDKWFSEQVNLKVPLDSLSPFISDDFPEIDRDYQFHKLDDQRFEITSTSEKGIRHVIFMPAQNPLQTGPRFKVTNPFIHVWEAPLGPYQANVIQDTGLDQPGLNYLHHNLSDPVEVVLDPDFPDEYISSIKRVIQEWNQALRAPLLHLSQERQPIDLAECLSHREFCINWSGPTGLAWTDVGAKTYLAYDPESGEIIGGASTFINRIKSDHDLQSTPEDDQRVLSDQIDRDWVIQTFLRKSDFANFRSPVPEAIVTGIMLHETGHFLGLAHNFAGSILGSVFNPSFSVMTYIPFPVTKYFTRVGLFDIDVIRAVYDKEPVPPDYEFCSDLQRDIDASVKQANCNGYTLGNPALWYMDLATQSTDGPFTIVPGTSHTILTHLTYFFDTSYGATPEQVTQVQDFLCENSAWRAQLLRNLPSDEIAKLPCLRSASTSERFNVTHSSSVQ